MKLVVTGTGRCGTRWFAASLTAAGLACSHETVFTFNGPKPGGERDSSWMAVPHLPVACPVLLVVRDPLTTLASFMARHFFNHPSPFRSFLYAHLSGLEGVDQFQAFNRYYREWNMQAAEHAAGVVDIDRLDWTTVERVTGMTASNLPPLNTTPRALPPVAESMIDTETRDVYRELVG